MHRILTPVFAKPLPWSPLPRLCSLQGRLALNTTQMETVCDLVQGPKKS